MIVNFCHSCYIYEKKYHGKYILLYKWIVYQLFTMVNYNLVFYEDCLQDYLVVIKQLLQDNLTFINYYYAVPDLNLEEP